MLRHSKSLLQGLIDQHLGLGSNLLKGPIQLLNSLKIFTLYKVSESTAVYLQQLACQGRVRVSQSGHTSEQDHLSCPKSLHRQGSALPQGPHLYPEQFAEDKLYCFLSAKRNYKGTN